MSTDAASLEAPRNGALWVVQVLGATLLLISGLAKLSGVEQGIETFDAMGITNGFVMSPGSANSRQRLRS